MPGLEPGAVWRAGSSPVLGNRSKLFLLKKIQNSLEKRFGIIILTHTHRVNSV